MFSELSLIYLTFLYIINGCISFYKYWYDYNFIENMSYTIGLYDHIKYNKLVFDIHSISHLNWSNNKCII